MLMVELAVPRNDVRLGVVRAGGVVMSRYPNAFDRSLQEVAAHRARGLGTAEEARRAAARDMLRNGSYKPTGRGKPASEYLLRAASEGRAIPRINGPVDVCNLLSLKHVVPVSLWDLDRCASQRFLFRLGRPGEGYTFNEGGQRIDVEDLLVGCCLDGDDDSTGTPIVNPVRDSQATKTTTGTRRAAACVYAPSAAFSDEAVRSICREMVVLLAECGDETEIAIGMAEPHSRLEV